MANYVIVNIAALIGGYLLDLAIGDPERWPHMVRAIGWLIQKLEAMIRPLCAEQPARLLWGGGVLALLTTGLTLGTCLALLWAAGQISPYLRFALLTLLAHQTLATKNLRDEASQVCDRLNAGDLDGARGRLARIVGRDTAQLSEAKVVTATVETLSENLGDGVIAPLFYNLVLGVPGGVFYKAVNTLDSTVGYKNDRYLYFGRASAKLDDLLNFIPARLAALCLAAVCPALGLDGADALRTVRRDGGNHLSPNSGRPEAAAAGALGIRLGGGSFYGGRFVDKPTIGDDLVPPEPRHIRLGCRLVLLSSLLAISAGSLIVLILLKGVSYL